MARELATVELVANPLQRAADKVRNRGVLWAVRLVLYALLIDLGFVYFLPMAFMILTSFKSPLDLENPTIGWLPTGLFFQNYTFAWSQLDYGPALLRSVLIVVLAVVGQVLSTALAGYGFARYNRIRGVWALFLLAIFTFLVPPQTILVSLFLNFKTLGWLNTLYPLIVPEWFAQGINGAFFIFIFRQAFAGLPWELEEAARVDGASAFGVFRKVMLPLVRPSIAAAVVFSVVWHWNNTFEAASFLSNQYKLWPLSLELQDFTTSALSQANPLSSSVGGQANAFQQSTLLSASSTGVIMAASMLVIIPPVIFYLLMQRVFVQGVERSGLIE